MKQKTLSKEIGYVDSWEIKDKKDVHVSHRTAILEFDDVKQFIKEILEEVEKNLDMINTERLKQIIKQKAGKELIE